MLFFQSAYIIPVIVISETAAAVRVLPCLEKACVRESEMISPYRPWRRHSPIPLTVKAGWTLRFIRLFSDGAERDQARILSVMRCYCAARYRNVTI